MISVLLVDLGTPRDEVSEPLGIETLAPYLEKEFGSQIKVDLKSLELDNFKSVAPYLSRSYSVIGLSTKIRAYDRLARSLEVIREKSPRSKIFVGDVLSTYAFEEILQEYPEVICVRGEGEEALALAVRALFFSKNPQQALLGVPNLAFVLNGEIVTTNRQPFDTRQALLPKRTLAPAVFQQYGLGRLEASRGCAYSRCSFCGVVEKYSRPEWKPFSVDFVVKDLLALSAMGFTSPYFTDEDFFGNDTARIHEMCERIVEEKQAGTINPKMDLYVNLRVNSVLGIGFGGEEEARKLLKKLRQAGVREIFIGLESGCREQLVKRYSKGVNKAQNIRAIRILRELGFETDLGFIFFDQDSTLQELRENLNFIYQAGIARQDSQLIKRVRLEPRTPIGLKFLADNPEARIDLDSIEYPYEFKHPEVAIIFNVFTQWQSRDLDVVYNLQSFCRGEIPKGYSRTEVKSVISQYRELDVHFLDAILSVFQAGSCSRDYRITATVKEFETKRNSLNSLLLKRIQWLDSNFRRFQI